MSVLVPFLAVPVVHDFPRAQSVVAVGREMSHHGARILEDLVFVPVLEAELLRGVWVDSRGKTGPRRVADRDVAMGLGEGYPALDELSQVRSLGLRVPAQGLDVIVQVVADDEQDVRFFSPEERKANESNQPKRNP